MRTTVLVGKIGPMFRTREEKHGMAEIHCYYRNTISQHYIVGTIYSLAETRARAIDMLFGYAAEEFGVYGNTPLGLVILDEMRIAHEEILAQAIEDNVDETWITHARACLALINREIADLKARLNH